MTRYVDAFASGRDLDAAHARAGVPCTGCHAGYTFAVRAKTAALYALGVVGAPTRRRYGDAMCNACHVSLERQAQKTDFLTRNPHRSHWPELACVDCHVGHGRQIDFCDGCHDNGGQRLTGDPVSPRAPNPWFLFRGECREGRRPTDR